MLLVVSEAVVSSAAWSYRLTRRPSARSWAFAVASTLGLPPAANWTSIADRMYLPIVELAPGLRVHPEFEGYTTKVGLVSCRCSYLFILSTRLKSHTHTHTHNYCAPLLGASSFLSR
jgi:hypothetical protein